MQERKSNYDITADDDNDEIFALRDTLRFYIKDDKKKKVLC